MNVGPLLIIWHSRTGTSERLAEASAGAAGAGAMMLRASKAAPNDLLGAGGYLFCCPENLATMSGEMKEMFDRCYYPLLGKIEGRPYATIIAAGSDGEGAQSQIDRITTGWRLKRVADPWIVNTDAQKPEDILAPKTVDPGDIDRAGELGAALAEGLSQGIF